MTMAKIGVGTYNANQQAYDYIKQVLDSGRLSYGPFSKKLEERFASLHGCKFGVLSNSGTSSLQVGLQALKELHGWQDGDEVLVPAVTFVATVNVVLHNRLTPVLVDVESDHYGIGAEFIESAITKKTKAIIPVHLFGQPCNMRDITEIANRHNLKILADSCEAAFATHNELPIGAWGNIVVFSFYVAHLLTAGVGGITITNSDKYAGVLRSLVNHGRCTEAYFSIDDDDGLIEENLHSVVAKRFLFNHIGHSFRITEFEAAIALSQIDDMPDIIHRRQLNAGVLTRSLLPLQHRLQLPSLRPNTSHSFMMYPIVMREEEKWGLCNYLEEKGVETREMLRLTDQPCYKGLWEPRDYPVAEWINRGGFYVGCHQGLTFGDMEVIAELIHGWCKEN